MAGTLRVLRLGDWRGPDLIARAVPGPAAPRGDRPGRRRAAPPAFARRRRRSAQALPGTLRASRARRAHPPARRAEPALPLPGRPPRWLRTGPAGAHRAPTNRESERTPEPVDRSRAAYAQPRAPSGH